MPEESPQEPRPRRTRILESPKEEQAQGDADQQDGEKKDGGFLRRLMRSQAPDAAIEELERDEEEDALDREEEDEGPITVIPELPDDHELVQMTTIKEDLAFLRISFDPDSNEHLYEVIEPQLSEKEKTIMEFLRDTLLRTLEARHKEKDSEADILEKTVERLVREHSVRLSEKGLKRILYYLERDFLGYGPIDIMMKDPELEDISCDGPDIPIYVYHRRLESIRTSVRFLTDLEMDSFVIALAQRSGKHISIADPLLDATLPDGSRLQATLSREVTSRGSSFTIRRFRKDPMTPPTLMEYGTMTAEMAAYFWFLVEEGRSLLYAGGTASGKTTSLNAVCQFIPPEKKVVSIEDTREINLEHENWIAGVTRSGFGGGRDGRGQTGGIDMYKLLEAALRQRPEYLLVGEVRGHEAFTLFQAMATGHAVYGTMHADSVQSVVYRLENDPINVPRMMLGTLDVVAIQVYVRLESGAARRIKEVVEIVGFDPDTNDLLTNSVFRWNPATDGYEYTGQSEMMEEIRAKKGWDEKRILEEWARRKNILEWMRNKGYTHLEQVSKILRQYYKRPEALIERMEADD